MKKNLFSLMLIATIVTGMVAVLWAAVPPPPVNQNLSFYDASIETATTNDCLVCHISHTVLVKRHHDLIKNEGMECLDCHTLQAGSTYKLNDFRTCSVCHKVSPHHTTTEAAAQDCVACHGSVIDNPGDGHYIPTYDSSSVTPLPNGKEYSTNVYVQGCKACHRDSSTATPAILTNAETHHSTGLGFNKIVGECTWCHVDDSGTVNMRTCEKCHGVKSLHNIQWKANNAVASPGNEALGYGHIGNNWDCVGCHYSWYGAASTFGLTTAMAPVIKQLSSYTLTADKEQLLTIHGLTFVNIGSNGVTYNPTVSVSKKNISYTLTPISFTDSEIQVRIPALPAGVYDLRILKDDDVKSNLFKLVVGPELVIKTAILSSSKTVTISGLGFDSAPPTDYDSGLGVYVGTVQAKILSWSDSKIVASGSAIQAGAEVTVKTLNGPISKVISPAAAKTRR